MSARRKVIIGLFVLLALALLLIVGALYVESIGVRSPEAGDTITELAKEVWAHQPWVVLLVSHMLACPIWFLSGHWFAASKRDYDAIRLRAMSREQLREALREKEA